MSKKEDQAASTTKPTEPAYTKAQFLSSSRYTPAQRDILAAVLEDEKTYTDAQAKQALEAYLKKELN
ncbi:hypothetical protein RJP21_29910 [Paenibacillus sp. VCA1]|uniref:hypothetical protein n=1 Tax=Paenibacillus sp. VCA1 TaxID=3039148 RepID=UPI002870EA88|nr:hypothetical protein [Paenibacillus sp. VCA1]MDR9857811.1 hypothetical protein [Paenibacillus sp. VCA1]